MKITILVLIATEKDEVLIKLLENDTFGDCLQDETKNLLLKQIQTVIKQDTFKPKDFLSALDIKKNKP